MGGIVIVSVKVSVVVTATVACESSRVERHAEFFCALQLACPLHVFQESSAPDRPRELGGLAERVGLGFGCHSSLKC